MRGLEAAEAPEIIDCTALASPSSMRKDRERVRRRYHAPRAHKRARARRNGWPSSRECLITDGKRLRSGVTTLFQLDW